MSLFRPRKPSDLRQAMDEYLKEVPADAPIRRVVASQPIEKHLAAFDAADAIAIGKQSRYWQAGKVARLAGLLGVLIVPLELLPVEHWLPSWAPIVVNLLRGITLVLTFVAIILLGLRRSAVKWKTARCTAEKARADLFKSLVHAASQTGELRAGLSCFEKAHLDWQMGFYAARIRQLPERIKREDSGFAPFRLVGIVLSVGAAVLGLVAVWNFMATQGWYSLPHPSAVFQWLPEPGRWQHGLHATASSLLAFAGARFLTHEDISNSALYPWAHRELARIKGEELASARAAAANGEIAVVSKFCERVQTVMDAEHAVWASGTASAPHV